MMPNRLLAKLCGLSVVAALGLSVGFGASHQSGKSGSKGAFPPIELPSIPGGPLIPVLPMTATEWGFPSAQGLAVGPPGVLDIENGVFTVNGQKRFLLFFSYFGALRDAVLHPDWLVAIFNAAAAQPYLFEGVRVFPMWWNDPPGPGVCGTTGSWDPYSLLVFDPATQTVTLNFAPLPAGTPPIPGGYHNSVAGRFQFLLDQAWEKGLLVDVSFAPETVPGVWSSDPANDGSLKRFATALSSLAAMMKTLHYPGNGSIPPQTGYYHAFFDVANEANCCNNLKCKLGVTSSDVATLLAGVRQGDSERLATASTAAGEPPQDWAFASGMTANLVAYHEPRARYLGTYPWWQMSYYRIAGYPPVGYQGYRQVTNDTIPIHFGEPERHRYCSVGSDPYICPGGCDPNLYTPQPGCANNYVWEQFVTAAVGAKQAGAAGWTWHTAKLFRFASNYSPGLSEVELQVITNLRPHLNAVTWPR